MRSPHWPLCRLRVCIVRSLRTSINWRQCIKEVFKGHIESSQIPSTYKVIQTIFPGRTLQWRNQLSAWCCQAQKHLFDHAMILKECWKHLLTLNFFAMRILELDPWIIFVLSHWFPTWKSSHASVGTKTRQWRRRGRGKAGRGPTKWRCDLAWGLLYIYLYFIINCLCFVTANSHVICIFPSLNLN